MKLSGVPFFLDHMEKHNKLNLVHTHVLVLVLKSKAL